MKITIPRWFDWPALLVFGLVMAVLLRTVVPTVYTLDSGEFVIGAQLLGIVHSPGYPLYLLVLHLFQQIPLGDIGFRGNLFSAVCLALAAGLTYQLLVIILKKRWLAGVTALIFAWSYYVWVIGLFAEVYAPQLFTIALAGVALVRLGTSAAPGWRSAIMIGVLVGLAISMNPTSIFLTGGVVAVVYRSQFSWPQRITAGLVSIVLFGAVQFYFPWRYATGTPYNLAGHYTNQGEFNPVDLSTLSGITWMISGQQFDSLFFEEGVIPPPAAWIETFLLFIRNFIGIGVVIGLVGLYALYRQHRSALVIWSISFIPYIYFYTSYGAPDKETMFGPALWLWCIPIGLGLRWVATRLGSVPWLRWGICALPVLFLLFHFPRLDLSHEWSIRQRAEAALSALPPDALLFGRWHDVVPLEYLHLIEKVRPDVKIYNLFLFPPDALEAYIAHLLSRRRSVLFISSRLSEGDLQIEMGTWLLRGYQVEPQPIRLPADEVPLFLYTLRSGQ